MAPRKLIPIILLLLLIVFIYVVYIQTTNTITQNQLIEDDPISQLKTKTVYNAAAHDVPTYDQRILQFSEAWEHIGEVRTVEGQLKYVFNNGVATILGFKNHHRGETKIRILKQHYGQFPKAPDQLYTVGQVVQIRGKIQWYQGDPVIYLSNPSQIQLIKV